MAPRPTPASRVMARDWSQRASSSMATQSVVRSAPPPPYSSGNGMPNRPRSPMASTVVDREACGRGPRPRRAGRSRPRRSRATTLRSASCSSVSSSPTGGDRTAGRVRCEPMQDGAARRGRRPALHRPASTSPPTSPPSTRAGSGPSCSRSTGAPVCARFATRSAGGRRGRAGRGTGPTVDELADLARRDELLRRASRPSGRRSPPATSTR